MMMVVLEGDLVSGFCSQSLSLSHKAKMFVLYTFSMLTLPVLLSYFTVSSVQILYFRLERCCFLFVGFEASVLDVCLDGLPQTSGFVIFAIKPRRKLVC